jgi:hypothetical protein
MKQIICKNVLMRSRFSKDVYISKDIPAILDTKNYVQSFKLFRVWPLNLYICDIELFTLFIPEV